MHGRPRLVAEGGPPGAAAAAGHRHRRRRSPPRPPQDEYGTRWNHLGQFIGLDRLQDGGQPTDGLAYQSPWQEPALVGKDDAWKEVQEPQKVTAYFPGAGSLGIKFDKNTWAGKPHGGQGPVIQELGLQGDPGAGLQVPPAPSCCVAADRPRGVAARAVPEGWCRCSAPSRTWPSAADCSP